MQELQTQQLYQLVEDYYTVTGQRIGIFDAQCHIIMEYPKQHGEFCSIIRSNPLGSQRCDECDLQGMAIAQRTGGYVVYRCHAGLIEVCAPIQDDENNTVGYVMFGQLLDDKNIEDQWEDTNKKCADIFSDKQGLCDAFYKIQQFSKEYLEATAHIMTACVGYIRLKQLMKVSQEGLWGGIKQYISHHFTRPFTMSEMADALCVSITTLCKTAKSNSGKTIGQLVLEKRIQCAKQGLADTNDPIYKISEMVGMNDYNYFSRIFHRETGLSPREYRCISRHI